MAPRKKSYGKKPKETMRQRQLRLIREAKARKAAKANAPKPKKALPSKGGTTANRSKARYQRLRTRGRQAENQVRAFGEALRKTMKQRAAQDKLDTAKKGTKGSTVRTGNPKPSIVKRGSSALTKPQSKGSAIVKSSKGGKATDARIKRVRVRVEDGKRQLTGSGNRRALPAAKGTTGRIAGGSAPKQLPAAGQTSKGRTYPKGKPSARRANAAAKQVRAAQGTKGTKVRTGQPAGSANRMYGANRVKLAVGRAKRAATLGKLKGALTSPKAVAAEVFATVTPAFVKQANKNPSQPSLSRLGLTSQKGTTNPYSKNYKGKKKKGMSNIPASEGTGGKAETTLKYGKGKASTRKPASGKGGSRRPSAPASRPSTPSRRSSAPARKPQSKDMAANYRAWAKANPKLAAKLKKGQAGYDAIHGKRKAAKGSDANDRFRS